VISRRRSAFPLGVTVLVAVLGFGSDPALAIGLQGTYSEWQLPPSTTGPYTGYYNVDSNLYVVAEPTPHPGQSSPSPWCGGCPGCTGSTPTSSVP
jgi:hypothetical protein